MEHSDLEPLTAELLDVGVHALVDSGALKELPIVAALNALWRTGATVRDELLTRRMAAFLAGVSDVSKEKRAEMIARLQSESHPEKVGELLFSLLDRFESTEKARLLARTFKLLVGGVISADEFWRVAYVLESLPRRDLSTVASWRTADLNTSVDRLKRSLYLSVGLVWFVLNASSTGFVWHDRLCTIFSDHLLKGVG